MEWAALARSEVWQGLREHLQSEQEYLTRLLTEPCSDIAQVNYRMGQLHMVRLLIETPETMAAREEREAQNA